MPLLTCVGIISSLVNHLSFRCDLSPPLTSVKVSPPLRGEGNLAPPLLRGEENLAPPLLRGEGNLAPPSLVGKGAGGLGFFEFSPFQRT